MPSVLILEPSAEVRELFSHVVTRMGHRPVYAETPLPAVVLVEPASPPYLGRALALRHQHPDLPIVCASTDGPNPSTRKLRPAAFLEKPFELRRLTDALTASLESAARAQAAPSSASSPAPLGS